MSMTRRARTLAYHRRRAAETTGEVSAGHTAQAEAALALLHAAKQCEDCGTPLEDPVSIARRVGPSCWAKQKRGAAGRQC